MTSSRHHPLRRVALGLAVCVASSVLASPASADSPAAAEEKRLGDAAFEGRLYAEALDHYRAAVAKGADARAFYNMARVLTFLGRYPEALVAYQKFLANAPSGILNDEQQKSLFKLIEEVKGKIAAVRLSSDVTGARVLVRGTEVGTTPLPDALSVNAGTAKVEVIAEGYRPFEATLELAGGATVDVDAKLARVDFSGTLVVTANVPGATILVDGVARGASPVTVKVQQGPHNIVARAPDYLDQAATARLEPGQVRDVSVTLRRAPSYTLAYVGAGVALTGVGVGTATGIAALSKFKKDDCDPVTKTCGPASHSDLDTSKLYGTLSTVSFVVGGAGALLGVYGWLKARRELGAPPVALGVGPGQVVAIGQF